MWQGYIFLNNSSQFNSQSAAGSEQVRNETLLMLMHNLLSGNVVNILAFW